MSEPHLSTHLPQLAGRSILFLNWRDPCHPRAGGAEAYCFEIARRLAAAHVEVTLFTARYPDAAAAERVEGVRVLRAGGTYGVYPAAALHLLAHRRTYDAVVDCQNGIPFFSPLFQPRWTAVVCVIHHIHQQQFDRYFRSPMNILGRFLEKQASRITYRNRPIVAVSPSTRAGIRRVLGFHNPVHLVPNGGPEPAGAPLPPRSTRPTIAVVSRMVAHKRIDWLLKAVARAVESWPELRVEIAGDGPELPRLRQLADRYGLEDVVTFHGYTDERRKRELLARAWLTVIPSAAEGWGLTAIEANTVGTPVLAYNVPGLRDAVRDQQTGWLLTAGGDLATGIERALEALSDRSERDRIATRCRAWADGFSWETSTDRMADVLLEEIRRIEARRRSRRQPSNLAVRARFPAQDPEKAERALAGAVRGTDRWTRTEDGYTLLLNQCDEMRACAVLRRLGHQEASLTLASHVDELTPLGPAS
ncbi:glycosyltransferase involved in cell wall biosynthesis [Kitasatospora sp. MAA4]|uniref:glycosyltransferase family 4 protein n=1 Tax=Kitasatospora sp. MAA4 TaxID=3035093 RepID=UPI002476F449|nr:glycosyltransferase family 4 protein [Kitasatospora sp. MAA4]MDH6137105.1 glycosyltransferase involved in cell wall biosynthesis [Kitasatospora sp. MAA4]